MSKVVVQQTRREKQSFGPCDLLVSENTLVFGERSVRLEPKVTQVLSLLVDRANEVVTREQLIDIVWAGRSVTDDAITRCISRLRKALGEELGSPIKIETLSKSGYRLLVDEPKPTHRGLKPFQLSAMLGVTLIVVAIFFFARSPGQERAFQRQALHVSDAWERYPEFSADGEWITFSKGRRGEGMGIYLQQYGGDGLQQLTPGDGYDHQPTFSPDGKQIAFARLKTGRCQVMVMPIIGGKESTVGECGAQGVKDLVWTPSGKALLMVTSEKPLFPGKLVEITLQNNQQRDITPKHIGGVDDLAISASGFIAISVHFELGVEDIYWAQLDDLNRWQRLTHDRIKIHGLAWSPLDDVLYFTSNRLGPFQLWRISLDASDPKVIHEALTGGDALSVHPDGSIVLERWQEAAEVKQVNLQSGQHSTLVNAKGVNWDAQFRWADGSKNREFIFVSDRSGSAELWWNSTTSETKITEYSGPWVMTPRWSPNGELLAFMVPLDDTFHVNLFDAAKKQMIPTYSESDAFAPNWSIDGASLYFGSKRSGDWQIWQKDLASGQVQQVTQRGGKVAQVSLDNRLFVSKADVPGIWEITQAKPESERKLIDDLAPVDWNNWRVVENDIFYVQRRPGDVPLLKKYSLVTGEISDLIDLPDFLYFSGIHFTKRSESIIYARTTFADADLDLLSLKHTN